MLTYLWVLQMLGRMYIFGTLLLFALYVGDFAHPVFSSLLRNCYFFHFNISSRHNKISSYQILLRKAYPTSWFQSWDHHYFRVWTFGYILGHFFHLNVNFNGFLICQVIEYILRDTQSPTMLYIKVSQLLLGWKNSKVILEN